MRAMPRSRASCLLLVLVLSCDSAPPGGLRAEVSIRRDDFGVLHIDAQTPADAMYASGYMQAHDRLLQMSLLRLQAQGRRAEVVPNRLDDDILMRTIGIAEMGRENAEHMRRTHPETHRLVERWTEGVNRRIDEVLRGEAPLPTGFEELGFRPEPWEISDGYAVGKLVLFGNASQIEFDLLATLIEEYVPDFADNVPVFAPLSEAFIQPPRERPAARTRPAREPRRFARPAPADARARLSAFQDRVRHLRPGASNNWALDGRHTASGRPLIAGDPHQALRVPAVFHMQHMRTADGALDVIGWSFVGTPGIQLGHNDRVVWTATSSYPDWMDLVDVIVPREGDTVELFGETHALVREVHEFTVAGQAEPEQRTILRVPGVGPILPDGLAPLSIGRPSSSLLLRWAGLGPTIEAHAFFQMNMADSLEEFEAAVDDLELGAFTFIAADVDAIGLRGSPRVPARTPGEGPRPWVLVPGDDPAGAWSGDFLPLDQLVRSRAPERGWLASANNDPFGFTQDGDWVGDARYYGVWFDPGTRAARIEAELARLAERGEVTLDDMHTLQLDTYSVPADESLPLLFDALDALGTDEALSDFAERDDLRALGDELRAWDRRLELDSSAAVLFTAWLYSFVHEAIGDELGFFEDALLDASPIYTIKFALLAARDAPALCSQGVRHTAMRALARAEAWLQERFGGADASLRTWGMVHTTFEPTAVFLDEFAIDDFPSAGGDGTVNVAAGTMFAGGDLLEGARSNGGSVYRMVAGFAEDGVPEARMAFTPGHELEPASDFYDNTHASWRAGELQPLAFREPDVEARTVVRMTLQP